MLSVCIDNDLGEGERSSVGCKDGRIFAVEISFVAIGFPGLFDFDVAVGDRLSVGCDCMLTVTVV